MNLKRVSIPHLENLTDEEFNAVRWAHKIDIDLKVDGAGIRFWKEDGKFIMGTSRVARIESAQQFIDHNPKSARCRAYAQLFEELESSSMVKTLPENITLIAEVLYKPLGYREGSSHVYVKVPYRIGNNLAIAVIDLLESDTLMPIDDNKRHEIMMRMIVEAGARGVLLFGSRLFSVDGGILPTTGSREEFRELLLSIAEKDVFWTLLGDINEGIVCRVGDLVFKVTTDEYRQLRKQK